MTDQIKAAGAVIVSAFTGFLVLWWLWEVQLRLGVPPVKDANGNVVDEFQRAKDILIVVLPLFSASLAYFVGSAGTGAAKQEAASARAKLNAILDTAPPGLLQQAKAAHQDAFTGPS